ncbi:MAG: hypothetical protein WKF84_02270 [Pyrinomonadaceae bacterium]
MLRPISLMLLLLLCRFSVDAQIAAPKIDGIVSPAEYGSLREGENTKISGGAQWFMTWDNTHLYIAITGSNPAHAAVIYMDFDTPAANQRALKSQGTSVGYLFEISAVKQLPFNADFVAYFKNDRREYRKASPRRNSLPAWGVPVKNFGAYAFAIGTTREISIPWAAITGGVRPAAFNFFGYLVMTDGFVYGQVPAENARGRISTTAVAGHYYEVKSTASGEPIQPFASKVKAPQKRHPRRVPGK